MAVALSVILLACGDDDGGSAKKSSPNGERSNNTGRQKPVPGGAEDAGRLAELDADELDADEPTGGDGSAGKSDADDESSSDAGNMMGGNDAGAGPDGGGGDLCGAPGEECASVGCCTGATCVLEPETGDSICAAECAVPSECNSGCCVPVSDSELGACVPATYCEAALVPVGSGCGGLVLIAEDGTFLGDAVSNRSAAEGTCNELSSYGSRFASDSIVQPVHDYAACAVLHRHQRARRVRHEEPARHRRPADRS
jgi:hypothetical protein